MTESSFPSWLAAQAAEREARGLTRRLAEADHGQPLLDLAGNDYLGLARDPRVVAGAVAAARAHGAGAGASRLVSGTLSIHTELEQAMAAFTVLGDLVLRGRCAPADRDVLDGSVTPGDRSPLNLTRGAACQHLCPESGWWS